jgi:endonuclease/exonuclease/phosphatase family metal-dependent hydrolase
VSVPGRSSPPGVRVATLNLWGRGGAWADRRRVLVEGLRALGPDLVAFQEAVRTGDYDQTVDLLGPGYEVAHQVERDADGSGASIASRWPLGEVHEVDLHLTPRTADFPCTTLVAEVLAPAPLGPLLFVNHKPSFKWGLEHERELQAVAAARFVEELAGRDRRHVVLVGDQDAVPEAACMRFWRGLQSLHGTSVAYQDAWEATHPGDPGHTFTPENPLVPSLQHPLEVEGELPLEPGRRIDHVLVRCDDHGPVFHVAGCRRVFDQPVDGVWASDHFGLLADLTLPGG